MLIKHFKLKILNKGFSKKAVLTLLTLYLLIAAGCGKRTPPLPPVERVSQRVVITGYQRGNVINLSWIIPARNAADSSTLNIDRVDLYRLAEPLDSPLSLTEEEFASRSTLIASIPVTAEDFGRKQLNYKDALDFAGQAVRLRYAVRFVNSSGQKAGFSNFLLIEPTAKIASAPSLLNSEVREDEVILNWTAPETNVDGTRPANLLGFNVYRKSAGNENYKVLNNQPITKNRYSDNFFEYDTTYQYFVRAISLGSSGEPVESLDSNEIAVTPRDVFAPSAPGAVTIAAAPNNLSIFFAVNPEKDIAGYLIYRSSDPNLPKEAWRLLTKELLTTNTFQDKNVESGKTYYYYLKAVDKAGNISPASEVFSETAP